ncbi:NAD(P)-dependent oxidoreductase [Pseudomonas gingeri]|uniref:NAD(P)-dependent oxidoreductase n=1 Tax=Pseudomonas gingeri TaxID=117681 RepID=UPI0015A27FEA|nr:NAD(P)-dependent oxidoreductase [Pseudomonas gingeri]NWD74017.1 NAD(P)-dependent oxidoreductase [Pseudomonas gingeri]
MSKIAVLGLGAMGSRMAKQLMSAGHSVVVWNRTPEAAQALVSLGARQAHSPREASQDAEFVIAMLRDDDASRQVWLDEATGALAGMASGTVALESSTLTPAWIRELGALAQQHGVSLLEAPVSGSRAQADAGQLSYLIGGEPPVLERSLAVLQAMGSSVQHVGRLGDGALAKLATNAMLGIQVTGLAEVVGLLKRSGADVPKVLQAMAKTSVWAPVMAYLSNTMLTENFAPQFPVELIEKDFSYTLKEAGAITNAPTIAAAHDVFLSAIAQGMGAENMTSVVKLFTGQHR